MEKNIKGPPFLHTWLWLGVARQQNSLFQLLSRGLVQSLGHKVTEEHSSNNSAAQTHMTSPLGTYAKCPLNLQRLVQHMASLLQQG